MIQLPQRAMKMHSRLALLLYHFALYATCVHCIKQISHVWYWEEIIILPKKESELSLIF